MLNIEQYIAMTEAKAESTSERSGPQNNHKLLKDQDNVEGMVIYTGAGVREQAIDADYPYKYTPMSDSIDCRVPMYPFMVSPLMSGIPLLLYLCDPDYSIHLANQIYWYLF